METATGHRYFRPAGDTVFQMTFRLQGVCFSLTPLLATSLLRDVSVCVKVNLETTAERPGSRDHHLQELHQSCAPHLCCG